MNDVSHGLKVNFGQGAIVNVLAVNHCIDGVIDGKIGDEFKERD